ncbi:MAG: hypothetical protein PF795_04240 [Kiritimatiellae bacterium]|jgi:hypothetical protein|nr:hypothetical protein [Kiritimatiellia bacterium]
MKVLFGILIFLGLGLRAEERILLRSAIQNQLFTQGEATLRQSENRSQIRIDLHTRHLGRVEATILESEQKNWPDSADSHRFQTALHEACKAAQNGSSGKISFLIEWTLTDEKTGQVRLVWSGGEQTLKDLSPDYIRRNMSLILMDQFDLTQAKANAFLSQP